MNNVNNALCTSSGRHRPWTRCECHTQPVRRVLRLAPNVDPHEPSIKLCFQVRAQCILKPAHWIARHYLFLYEHLLFPSHPPPIGHRQQTPPPHTRARAHTHRQCADAGRPRKGRGPAL